MKARGLWSLPSAMLVLAGCAGMGGPGKDPSAAAEKESKAEAQLCQDMSEKAMAIRDFPQVSSETPLSAIQEANDKAEAAVRDVQQAADDINNPNLLSVQAAFEQLQTSVNQVPGGRSTVGDAAPTISTNAQDLQTAWNSLYSELQCGA